MADLINLNTCSAEELTEINGVGEVLAETIVTYREENGPFTSFDQLDNVKGVGPKMLEILVRHVCIDDTTTTRGAPVEEDMADDMADTNSSLKRDHLEALQDMMEAFEPVVKKLRRPERPVFNFRHKNRRVVRIASWNVERFDDEKASNPGVKEVVCMTILENGFGLIAFQELADEKALGIICDELNNPTLGCIKKWPGPRGDWKFIVSDITGRMYRSHEYNGFLYDASQDISVENTALLEKPPHADKPFTRAPFIGTFKIHNFDCIIASVHLKATGLNNEDLDRLQAEIDRVPKLFESIEEEYPGENDIMILGDFNLDPSKEDFDILRERHYGNCIPEGCFTNISNSNPGGSAIYDHIWISAHTRKIFSGNSGVVREGLKSAFIPKGWSFGGVASDHCPVWAEIYTSKDYDDADLSADADFTYD